MGMQTIQMQEISENRICDWQWVSLTRKYSEGDGVNASILSRLISFYVIQLV